MEIDREQLVADHWEFAVTYHRSMFWSLPDPYLQDKLYDIAVTTFLRAVRGWRGEGNFRGYYRHCVRRIWWRYLADYRSRNKSQQISDYCLAGNDRQREAVDATDYFDFYARLLHPAERSLLTDVRSGLTMPEVAVREGRNLNGQKTRLLRLKEKLLTLAQENVL